MKTVTVYSDSNCVLRYVETMPEEPKHDVKCHSEMACICASLAFENGANRDVVDGYDDNCPHKYQSALQACKDSSIPFDPQERFISWVKLDIYVKNDGYKQLKDFMK